MKSRFKDPTAEDFDQMPLDDHDRREINKFFIRINIIFLILTLIATLIYLK